RRARAWCIPSRRLSVTPLRNTRFTGAGPGALKQEILMNATEVLGLELTVDRLFEKLIRTCIDTVLAERAVLAIDEAGLVIRATGNALGEVTLESTRLPAVGAAPLSILEHVLRSGEIVVLSEASEDDRFIADPYLSAHHVRSALAIPVGRAERRFGVLYF